MPEPQNADGTAHFTYFDKPTQLSFVWNGSRSYIDVSRGGYGEPVFDRYRPATMSARTETTANVWLDWYETVCKAYVATWEGLS